MLTRRETQSFSTKSALKKTRAVAEESASAETVPEKLYPLASFSTTASTRTYTQSSPNVEEKAKLTLVTQPQKVYTEDAEATSPKSGSLYNSLFPRGIGKYTYSATIREDLWQSLLQFITNKDTNAVKDALECLNAIESFWGNKGLKRLDIISQVCSIQHWDKATELTNRQLEMLPLAYQPECPEFYVLVVSPVNLDTRNRVVTTIGAELQSMSDREGASKFTGHAQITMRYTIVEVNSAYEALLAVLVNPDILSVVICDNIPAVQAAKSTVAYKHRISGEVWEQLLLGVGSFVQDPINCMLRGADVTTTLVEAIHACRSELDIYSVCSNANLLNSETLRCIVQRCFASLEDHSELHDTIIQGIQKRRKAPFFESLKAYAERPIGVFHALAISRGNSVRQSRWIQDLGRFYGLTLFKAESSATCGGLDSLLDPHGALKDAQFLASRTFGAQFTFFTTNGTSTSNKIVCQALTVPGDVVLVDRACHKSHHYSFVLQGAKPCYLDPYALQDYSMYGGVPLETIKRTLLAYKEAGKLDDVRLLTLTNCTFDGITYNVHRLIEECLAIKPTLCFLFDEAWFAYAYFHPIFKYRTAMNAANVIRDRLSDGSYEGPYRDLCARLHVKNLDEVQDLSILLNERLYPDPSKAIVRVYATQSTHKSLTSLRQGSMILCNDDLFESHVHTAFKEAYYTHMSTSPNYQIIASMDMGRVQMDLEGYKLVQRQIESALCIRYMVKDSPQLSSCFAILSPNDMIPEEHRLATRHCVGLQNPKYDLEKLEKMWLSDDFFALDPTRLTLFIGRTGLDGESFKVDWLMNKYGIQVNKTSRNSVLFQTNIGTDRSSCLYLVQCLERAVNELDAIGRLRGVREAELAKRNVNSLVSECPLLPSFNYFHSSFCEAYDAAVKGDFSEYVRHGDIRTPYFLAYDEELCEYYEIHEALKLIKGGKELVSSTFIIPYPPGFPVAVPGQLLTQEILIFLLALDVKEIHGYDEQLGLRCFKDLALVDRQVRRQNSLIESGNYRNRVVRKNAPGNNNLSTVASEKDLNEHNDNECPIPLESM